VFLTHLCGGIATCSTVLVKVNDIFIEVLRAGFAALLREHACVKRDLEIGLVRSKRDLLTLGYLRQRIALSHRRRPELLNVVDHHLDGGLVKLNRRLAVFGDVGQV
jgi:hypothetical protein